MNVAFLTLLYHPDELSEVSRLSRDGLQNQIDAYQWAFVEGIREKLAAGEGLAVVNALPVGAYPTRYRKLFLKGRTFPDGITQLGGLNLPPFKQRGRAKRAERALERWIAASPDNRTVLIYSLYMPYMRAAIAVKRRHPDVRVSVIVPALPNELGIASGRTGLMKRAEYAMGRKRIDLCAKLDGFVLLTAPMAEALPIAGKPATVIEGLVSREETEASPVELPSDARPAALYTGTLNRELGIGLLLEAFQSLPNLQLWLCGRGDMENEIGKATRENSNICYFGFVPRSAALYLQKRAAVLVNPRTAQGTFTRYSFPSKTLEYMRSGVPVACCKLEGIPDEYDGFLRYIEPQNAQGIRNALNGLMALAPDERAAIGERARAFVTEKKNSAAQCTKLVGFLRSIR